MQEHMNNYVELRHGPANQRLCRCEFTQSGIYFPRVYRSCSALVRKGRLAYVQGYTEDVIGRSQQHANTQLHLVIRKLIYMEQNCYNEVRQC